MKYHAEYLGDLLHKAFQEFDPDDNADALALMLNEYTQKGFTLQTSVFDPNSNNTILVFTLHQSDGAGEVWTG